MDSIINESNDKTAVNSGVINENNEQIPSASEVDGLGKTKNPLEVSNLFL